MRFVLPQTPRVITAGSQVRGMQVVTALASIRHRGDGERIFAIDQSVIEWANDLRELRVTIDTACQGAESTINRVMYHAIVLAQTRRLHHWVSGDGRRQRLSHARAEALAAAGEWGVRDWPCRTGN